MTLTRPFSKSQRTAAFSRLEILSVAVISIVLLSMFLPALARAKAKPSRINCVLNLKNIGLAYRIFASDHHDQFPFQFSVTNGGSMEMTNDIAYQFRILSNELATPRILICSERKEFRLPARDWASLHRTNIDYFLGFSARQDHPDAILSGERGFEVNGVMARDGIFTTRTNDQVRYATNFHVARRRQGLLKSDGSIDLINLASWRPLMVQSGFVTNTFLVP